MLEYNVTIIPEMILRLYHTSQNVTLQHLLITRTYMHLYRLITEVITEYCIISI